MHTESQSARSTLLSSVHGGTNRMEVYSALAAHKHGLRTPEVARTLAENLKKPNSTGVVQSLTYESTQSLAKGAAAASCVQQGLNRLILSP